MAKEQTRRYSIEIKDPDNKSVPFTAVEWTDEERFIAVAGLPDDNRFTAPAIQKKKSRGKT